MKPLGGFASGDGAVREWFSAKELADLKLAGLPSAKNKVNERAVADHWALKIDGRGNPLARPRAGRGGGTEYHVDVLPSAARQALVKRGLVAAPAPANVTALPASPSSHRWAIYDALPATAKARAATRLRAIDTVEAIERTGMTRSAAVATAAAQTGVSTSSLWNWLLLVSGCSPHDRLPALAPMNCAGGREATIGEDLWDTYKSDWLRPEKPTHAACYARLKRIAAEDGQVLPHAITFRRRIEREVPAAVVTATRDGAEAVRKLIPAQVRTVAGIPAMSLVNIDGHKWDVFVRWPDGHIARPMMIAIQDVHSRKMLAWRIGQTESAVETRLCFADLFRDHGIPKACLMDNGRAFASKWITGGAKSRFRFKILADEPLGLLTQLGIENLWATPYRGQSKPIERTFRDYCGRIAKHPAFAGAYVGNKVDAKPENYGSNAIDLDVFKRIVGQEIAALNAETGRDTEMCRHDGSSFDQAFSRSIAAGAPVGVATAEHMRLALLTAERVRADRNTGMLVLAGNRYWMAGLSAVAGQLITVRFDPDNLHSEVHAYRADGGFLGVVPIFEATGFRDVEAAKTRAKMAAEHKRAVRDQVKLQGLLSAADLAARMPGHVEPEPRQRANVIRPVRVRGSSAAAAVAVTADDEIMDRFAAGLERTRSGAGLRLVE